MPQSDMTFRFLAEPSDVNFGGKMHGGAVMKWIDQAGYACATAWSGSYCVTAYVGGIQFLKAINIGDLVEVHARIIYTGRTSMHIQITVHSGDPKEPIRDKTTTCIMIFVGVDADGKPKPIREWVPENDQEKALKAYAVKLMEKRKEIRAIEI